MAASDLAHTDWTDDRLLGGRICYRQPRVGYRTGIEPVLLAASIPAQPGERVLEGGTGAGAGLLCLAARCPGVSGTGIERDAALAVLAQANLADNGVVGIAVVAADMLGSFDAPALEGSFDHAFANPPWHREHSTASPNPMRDAAKRGHPSLLHAWASAMAQRLRPGGSVTMIVPAGATAAVFAALEAADCGSPTLLPLWPRQGVAARIVVVRAHKGRRGDCAILPGLVLHVGDGFTPEATAILWHGAALVM